MNMSNINIGMLVGPGFEDLEFWAVYMRMKEERAQITVIGTEANKEYTSKNMGKGSNRYSRQQQVNN